MAARDAVIASGEQSIRGKIQMEAHDSIDTAVDTHSHHEAMYFDAQPSAQAPLCDLCGHELARGHRRLIDLATNLVLAACAGCEHSVVPDGRKSLRYQVVSDRYVRLPRGVIKSGRWDALRIPVALAFLVHRSLHDEYVAYYPSPNGPLVEELTRDQWADMMGGEHLLESLQSDVEALLVDARGVTPAGYIVPITTYFDFDRRLGDDWRGYDGGLQAAGVVDAFVMSLGSGFHMSD
jgi:hypothetical protein